MGLDLRSKAKQAAADGLKTHFATHQGNEWKIMTAGAVVALIAATQLPNLAEFLMPGALAVALISSVLSKPVSLKKDWKMLAGWTVGMAIVIGMLPGSQLFKPFLSMFLGAGLAYNLSRKRQDRNTLENRKALNPPAFLKS